MSERFPLLSHYTQTSADDSRQHVTIIHSRSWFDFFLLCQFPEDLSSETCEAARLSLIYLELAFYSPSPIQVGPSSATKLLPSFALFFPCLGNRGLRLTDAHLHSVSRIIEPSLITVACWYLVCIECWCRFKL